MGRILLVDYEPYHRNPVKPQNFEAFCDMFDAEGRLSGLWCMKQWDPKTGDVRQEVWTNKVVTDNGAVNILASAIANASNSNPWNNILITNNDASTTLTAATGTSAITSLSVAALPSALPANQNLILGYGSGTTQTIAGPTSSTAQGATSLTVPSFTPSINFGIGTALVPAPNVSDNPTNANLTANASSPLSQYSGVIASGGFTYSNTTGAGNRSCTVVFVFKDSSNGGSTPIGSYTSTWLVNVTSGASNATSGLFVGNYVDHNINTPMRCDNNNNITATCTVKL